MVKKLSPVTAITKRIAAVDWAAVAAELDAFGCAVVGPLLTATQCKSLIRLFPNDDIYRSHILMARHNFGRGEYKYFAYPLPVEITELRTQFYPQLAEIANCWNQQLDVETRFPNRHADYAASCHQAGQTKATPLILRYEAGDYNCLHQDIYGEHIFPLQVAILLSEPDKDFVGGEFVLTEQRPRMQSRAEVVHLSRGCGVIFPVNQRPVQGTRGTYRVNMRHGVSRIHSGERYTLGIIFHDAR